ncbi:hypothetical protein ACMA1I_04955 [Pontibacter sp. 13R65]|uniref:hypothetical protein n=1 Tax=Pontibacter sp. 13R65 TaxID=3127458 RepID=UPI00301BF043
MEDQKDRAQAIFLQICDVNDLDPEMIKAESQTKSSEKLRSRGEAEVWIYTALNYRAMQLLQEAGLATTTPLKGDGGEYSIDADPAAPAFVINEDTVRSKHEHEVAEQIINALAEVKLPVQA